MWCGKYLKINHGKTKYRLSKINKSKNIQEWKRPYSRKLMLISDPHLVFNCLSITTLIIHNLLCDVPLLLCIIDVVLPKWANFTSTLTIFSNINGEIIIQKSVSGPFPQKLQLQTPCSAILPNLTHLSCSFVHLQIPCPLYDSFYYAPCFFQPGT